MMLVLAGMIGVGKTTMTTALAEAFNTQPFYESVEDNVVLDRFYDDPKRYAFDLQINFLNKRFKAIKQALQDDNNILDRSIYEDALFTYINYKQGNIEGYQMDIYNELLENMMEELEGMPKKAPDLLIYLDADFDTILNHIKERGRDFEQWDDDPELLEYYRTLWEHYQHWYEDYNYSPKMKISVSEYHPDDEESMRKVIEKIAKALLREHRDVPSEVIWRGIRYKLTLQPNSVAIEDEQGRFNYMTYTELITFLNESENIE